MSRIAGIVQFDSSEPLIDIRTLLTPMDNGQQWKMRTNTTLSTSMGWMGSQDGRFSSAQGVVISFDGTIYNRSELGRETSDSELIRSLYLRHGFEATLHKLNGDFAIALYDEKDRVLWLGRDRFGIKPLYYTQKSHRFGFASRPAGLIPLLGNHVEINTLYVTLYAGSHYRCFDNRSDTSPFRDIFQIAPAQALRVQTGSVKIFTYWSLVEQGDFSENEDVLAERYQDLLLDSVKIRFQAAKKPAFTLSGGLDSSSVLASAVHQSGKKQEVFSTVYSDKTYDESEEIKPMLATTTSRWHAVLVEKPDLLDVVGKMIALHDEPIATATWLSHYLMCHEVKEKGFLSIFGGLGGDELNAGEYEHYFFHFADLRHAKQEDVLKHEVTLWAKYHDHPIYRKNFKIMEQNLKQMVDMKVVGKCIPYDRRLKRYFNTVSPDFYNLSKIQLQMTGPFKSYLKNRTFLDISKETAPCCLRAEDRQSQAFGLDHFLPFFDHRLVEFMFRVPGRLKIRDGVTKHLLRKAMRGILCEETRTRIKKTGWNAPAHLWFSGSSRDQVFDLLRSQKFRSRGIYNLKEVERLFKEHCDIVRTGRNEESHAMFFWQLVNLELWFRQYVDPPLKKDTLNEAPIHQRS
jgi:asparagine synthase (glutamine-hydrolysing)